MAIGRLSMKVGKAGKAGPHAAYIAREGQYASRLERGEKLERSIARKFALHCVSATSGEVLPHGGCHE